MTTQDNNQQIPEASQKKKGKKPKKFIERQNRSWKGKGIGFKQLPDPIIDCKKICHSSKAVYWALFKKNPCRVSINELSQTLGMHKTMVAQAIKEFLARKIIVLIEKGKGPVPDLYEFEMDPSKWNLLEDSAELISKIKRSFTGSHREPVKNLLVPTVNHKKFTGSYREPVNDVTGSHREPVKNLLVPTVNQYRPHNENIPLDLISENILSLKNQKEKGEASAPLIGPASNSEQLNLGMMEVIPGNKKEMVPTLSEIFALVGGKPRPESKPDTG